MSRQTAPTLDPQQQKALDLMIAGKNIFLSGSAGTGKSVVLRAFIRHCEKNKINLAVVAPTGLAAQNLPNGMTVHRFFGFSDTLFQPGKNYVKKEDVRENLEVLDVLLIDEISMLRGDLLEAIELGLRKAKGNDLPYGGVSLIFAGDFLQLEPVAKPKDIWFLRSHGIGKYAFQTKAWEKAEFTPIYLTQIHRQSGSLFPEMLNALRIKEPFEEKFPDYSHPDAPDIDLIDALFRYVPIYQGRALPEGCTVLCPTTNLVNKINFGKEGALPGPATRFELKVSGKVDFDEINTPTILDLKIDSRIIMIANDVSFEGTQYFNGDQGWVRGICGSEKKAEITVELDRGITITVTQRQWLSYHYSVQDDPATGKKYLERSICGNYSQLPMKIAHALTYHKAQGMSLSRVFIILGNCSRSLFAPHMLYTALSRATELGGVCVSREICMTDIKVNRHVLEFYHSLGVDLQVCMDGNLSRNFMIKHMGTDPEEESGDAQEQVQLPNIHLQSQRWQYYGT